jgi:hypothetical protein
VKLHVGTTEHCQIQIPIAVQVDELDVYGQRGEHTKVRADSDADRRGETAVSSPQEHNNRALERSR